MRREPACELSVVIPTHNRPAQLAAALRALARSTFPHERFEIIVVADGRGQQLDEARAAAPTDVQVAFLEQDRQGPGAARNLGAARARGRFLAFTDDDCEPDPDWLDTLAESLRSRPEALTGGETVNALRSNPFAQASQMIQDVVYAHYNSDPDNARFLASNNIALCAGRFRELDGFDPAFRFAAEDRDLCDRWRSRGWPMRFQSRAIVRHAHDLTLAGFCAQHFRYGRGAADFHRTRDQRGSGRISDEFSFHANLRNWVLKPLSGGGPLAKARMAGLLLAWQGSNALGFFCGRLGQAVQGVRSGGAEL